MGHSGNASPLRQISETFGVSQGHVVRCTARVLEAILDTPAITNAISLPAKGSAEREDAKRKMARVVSSAVGMTPPVLQVLTSTRTYPP
ncbi:hypothetical protein C356_03205 [Cryptococcus neoformans c45]|nr:hypothetical protein C356_03205 [Cryptococcus neoformans var. grubii c45]